MRRTILSMLLFGMAFCCLPNIVWAQSRTITGTVKNQAGEPVPGATIEQQGTQKCNL
jgi:hypothetical protein